MAEVREDAAARLWWGIRHYAWLVVVVLVTFVVLAAKTSADFTDDTEGFRATALVVATELQIKVEQLPRFASTLFEAGTVARETAARADVDVAPDGLIPERVTVEPIEGTILVRVAAVDRDPAVAARLANAAAAVLVEQLNAPGPGVGVFEVQERAVAPRTAEEATSPAFAVVLGLLAGVAFAAGTVGLVLVLRRPVLSAAEAVDSTGAPLLGVLPLPHRREVAPQDVPGVAALVSRLYPTRHETVVLVSVRGDRTQRARVGRLVARALARQGPVHYVAVEGDGRLPEAMPAEERRNVFVTALDGLKRADMSIPAVIDGPSTGALDVPQFLPGAARVVLVVREGSPGPALATAARQFLPTELIGVVFLPRARRTGRLRRTSGAAAATDGAALRSPDGLGADFPRTGPQGSLPGQGTSQG